MKIRLNWSSAMLLSVVALLYSSVSLASSAKVSISQIIDHPDLNATHRGLIDGLKERGYEDGKNLELTSQVADGKPAQAARIARELVSKNPHVLVGIATPSSQALVSATRTIPIVFTAVTDPVGARLVRRLENPGRNVTGLSDLSPVHQHVELIKQSMLDVDSIGVVYNPAESNAVTLISILKGAAEQHDLALHIEPVFTVDEVEEKTRIVAKKSDVVYAMTDNTVASAIDDLIQAANNQNTPVFAGTTAYVNKGAVLGAGLDYYQIGLETAEYVVAILEGEKPGKLDVKTPNRSALKVNLEALKKFRITLPSSILNQASVVQ
ncbi:ABC transporter substrate-binding protein [Vibrio sp. D404a]|uniref:ABC transporter substrate-binding protein n=1 Tax=unclassified Vibrio TaxID=2614977 RepID=UPI002553279C|nr:MULTISPECIES: ABC transporter substrate-binding protein [unclassified Vibrio]MDK9736663.1 ABC transporter substrate-binding protein [Vibrio sp. D404a]MDK9796972.1 ABC transporter substrate-binding protein [Vibrio sp. D449a]